MRLDVYPDKGCYRPGESVRLRAELAAGTDLEACLVASITLLCDEVAQVTETVHVPANGRATAELSWTPPDDAPRGYGVDLRAVDDAGRMLAAASTAFDVLEHWTQAPRYGFLSDFGPGRRNHGATMAWLARYHVNGLQFYDWMYRHEQLLPPDEVFADPCGRRLSLQTVRRLIDAAHARGIAAMPYTAVYAASPSFYREHLGWALLDEDGRPIPFGDDFLMIMDPTPGSAWAAHLMGEFERVLTRTGFDGIHLDQYGEPRRGYDARGTAVALDQAFPAFIGATKELVRRHRGENGAVIFNAVGNWPIETVASSDQDVVYIEVWPPYTSYQDLHRLIVEGQRLSGGKPVVLAAYIDPSRERSARLIDSIIFASGGYHIELGEPGTMLADPYFPDYAKMSDDLRDIIRHTYDFAVRYENVLAVGTRDATPAYADRVSVDEMGPAADLASNKIWPIVRECNHAIALNLVNLLGVESPEWNRALLTDPPVQEDLVVRLHTDRPATRVWWATPDGDNPTGRPLEFRRGRDEAGNYISFRVPSLVYWDLIIVEWGEWPWEGRRR
jgi:dextranase